MKAVILAAGKGTRMLPLTKDKQKVLIEIKGKPFLYYVIQDLYAAGITELGLVTNYKEEQVIEFLEKNKINAIILHQEKTKGTGDAIMTAREFTGNEKFIVQMGDNLYSPRDLQKIANNDEYWYMGGIYHKHPEKYGVLVVGEDGFVERVEEKPEKPPSNIINTGLYKFCPDVYEKLENSKLSERGEIEIIDTFNQACAEHRVKALISDEWTDFGCPKDIPKVVEFIKNRNRQ